MSATSRRLGRRRLSGALALLAAVASGVVVAVATQPATAATNHNYAEALQKSLLFYEAQMSGNIPSWNRVKWRGPSTVNDGKAQGVDLSGGYYDAGDHMKFGFPMAAAITTLAWGGVDYRSAYSSSGQLPHLMNNLRWANDYFINAHSAPNELWVQVANESDHNYWAPPETVEAKGKDRTAYKITASCPGTDVAAETASAMASSSMVFRATDPTYADTLLTHAKQLFTFADTTKGTDGRDTAYVKCVPQAASFYNSTTEGGTQNPGTPRVYWDELAWSALWLYRATGDASYLTKARDFYPRMGTQADVGSSTQVPVYAFGYGWNDKAYAVYAMMAKLTGEQQYKDDTQRYLDYWSVGYKGAKGKTLAGGLAYIFYWASLRMAANTAWVALTYADTLGPSDPLYARYRDFAKTQIDYALGTNPANHSYMIGFGVNPPKNPHHRGAHGSWSDSMNEPTYTRHTLYGALVGGPGEDGSWADSRSDFVKNEVALDFNSGITSSLARLYSEYGGTPLASIPAETPDMTEIYLDTTTTPQTNGVTVKMLLWNKSAWPARVLDKASIRYFFTLDGSTTPSQITVTSPYSNCQKPTGPVQFSGSVYYVNVDCTGTLSFPGGQSESKREVQLQIMSSGSWDASNDWSATNNPALYQAGTLIWGTQPGGGTPTTAPPTTAAPTTRPPTSAVPTTGGPTTRPPTSAVPTTGGPTTRPPTSAVPTTAGPTTAGPTGCSATYTVTSSWGSGFQGEVSVRNNGTGTLNGWTATWTNPGGVSITQLWNGTMTTSGSTVTVKNLSWNGTLGAGASATFGFLGSGSSSTVPVVTCTSP
ncbi:glycoside hydrolase family 9 protein [Luedemannella helvata]|uniref:Endoglucanase n=1 Tax=Luedemannella helvata TaxID=349315 RepID=A0ABN2L2W1_9ACTN